MSEEEKEKDELVVEYEEIKKNYKKREITFPPFNRVPPSPFGKTREQERMWAIIEKVMDILKLRSDTIDYNDAELYISPSGLMQCVVIKTWSCFEGNNTPRLTIIYIDDEVVTLRSHLKYTANKYYYPIRIRIRQKAEKYE